MSGIDRSIYVIYRQEYESGAHMSLIFWYADILTNEMFIARFLIIWDERCCFTCFPTTNGPIKTLRRLGLFQTGCQFDPAGSVITADDAHPVRGQTILVLSLAASDVPSCKFGGRTEDAESCRNARLSILIALLLETLTYYTQLEPR